MEVTTHSHKTKVCPYCNAILMASTGAGKTQPKPGDVTVCSLCINWLIYTEDGLRPITEDEIAELEQSTFEGLTRYSKILVVQRWDKANGENG